MSQSDDTLIQSIIKGIALSVFLVAIHIACSGSSNTEQFVKIVKIESRADFPVNTDDNARISLKSSSLHSTGYIEIFRDTFFILEILFSIDDAIDHYDIRVPLPLLSYLKILFTSAISVNAP